MSDCCRRRESTSAPDIELAAGAMLSARRHFVGMFKWVPLAQRNTWGLNWDLFEVVRDELVSVTSHELITAAGDEAPARSTIDLESLVRLRVNDAGDPEFSVLTGAARQTTVIESDAERQEWKRLLAHQARMRQDVARADPKRVLDVHRQPSLAYAADAADGCGYAFVYGWTSNRAEAIAVRVDPERLQISTGGTFDLATQTVGLDVRLHVYERAMPHLPFCTDVGMSGLVEEVWRPTRGIVTIQLAPAGLPVRAPGRSRATIRISGAQFVSPAGVRIDQTQPITLTAIVGQMAGSSRSALSSPSQPDIAGHSPRRRRSVETFVMFYAADTRRIDRAGHAAADVRIEDDARLYDTANAPSQPVSTSARSDQRGRRFSCLRTTSRRRGTRVGDESPTETSWSESTCAGTTCGTKRCRALRTTACRFTSCRCSPVTRASRRRSAT